jgi:hypothetical protein
MFFGLKKDPTKGVSNLFGKERGQNSKGYFKLMGEGFLAARDPRIALAYVGGFVARADSIVISLFIPTVVSHYFVEQGLCTVDPHAPTEEIKEVCRILKGLIVGMSTGVFTGCGVDRNVTTRCAARGAALGMVMRSV